MIESLIVFLTASVSSLFGHNMSVGNSNPVIPLPRVSQATSSGKFIETNKYTINDNNISNNRNSERINYGVIMQTKCIDGVCTNSRKYLSPAETKTVNSKLELDTKKMRSEVEARINEHRKKVDEMFLRF